MKRMTSFLASAIPALMMMSSAYAIELDPKIVGFKLPKDIKWTENTRSGNRTAVLQGDPSKPGPYAMLLTWLPGNMSRPHFHPNDRFFMVISGTWWVGNGGKFDPEATVPMPAGTHVIHWAKGVHYDGAKTEPATILVWGEGPRPARRSSPRRGWRRSSGRAATLRCDPPCEGSVDGRRRCVGVLRPSFDPASPGREDGGVALPPHRAHPRRHVDLRSAASRSPRLALRARPHALLEQPRDRRRDEARAQRVHVAVAAVRLIVRVEALRHDDVELVLRARHRDVEQPPLLLDLVASMPVARSDGMQPSTALSTNTDFHSCPLAEWMVERIR